MAQKKFKSNSMVASEWLGGTLQVTSRLGDRFYFDMGTLSSDNRLEALKNGILQKISDAGAIKAPTRKPGMDDAAWKEIVITHIREKFQAMKETAEYLAQGDVPWKRTGGGEGNSLLLPAICRLKPNLTVAQVAAFIESRTKEQLAALKVRTDVVAEMNKIRLERAGMTQVTVDDGFDEFMKLGDGDGDGEGDSDEDDEESAE